MPLIKRCVGVRVSKVELPDVKASLRMSQHHFAAAYRIPLSTLKNWEQGRHDTPKIVARGADKEDKAAETVSR
jgi:DNA-binding transcriptional regulator YiaG